MEVLGLPNTRISGGISEHTFSTAALQRALPSTASPGNSAVGPRDPVLKIPGPSLHSHASSCGNNGCRGAPTFPGSWATAPQERPLPELKLRTQSTSAPSSSFTKPALLWEVQTDQGTILTICLVSGFGQRKTICFLFY